MNQKLMAAVNHLCVPELKWPLQNKFGFALAFISAIKRQDRTVCYRDVWVAKVRTILRLTLAREVVFPIPAVHVHVLH